MKRIILLFIASFFIIYTNSFAELSLNPKQASNYLVNQGLKPFPKGYYYDGLGYMSATPYKVIGDNNIAYYVKGNATTAKELKIILNINNKAKANDAKDIFLKASRELYKKALGNKIPQQIATAIKKGKPGRWKVGKSIVMLKKNVWPTGKGYDLSLIIN